MTEPDRTVPSRRQAVIFRGKAAVLQGRRWLTDLAHPVPRHPRRSSLGAAPVAAEVRADLWNHQSAAEFPLTAGKIQNLRVACAALDGVEVPAGATFSFWKQVGRTTRGRGYTTGRELREGCLIPNRGGGLCQLSNLLYGAALDSGLEIRERHAHSRTIPGSLAEADRDATVFWNYVDLRFRAPAAFRIEAHLTATELVIRIRTGPGEAPVTAPHPPAEGAPARAQATGDCVTCGMVSCFRNPNAVANHSGTTGHTAFLLDARWPEFDDWCARHSHDGDHWLLPLDPHRWNKPNYAWNPPANATRRHATVETLSASLRMRKMPAQGAARQRLLLDRDRRLAKRYSRLVAPEARHLVISQSLLPHLQSLGTLGGRTYDVLVTRWPLEELQRRLDEAARKHPASPTLADFRADPKLLAAEEAALDGAARLLTPHRSIAEHFGSRALLLDWEMPASTFTPEPDSGRRVFFPASPLGRKGVYELAAALEGLDTDLLVLGRAGEDHADPLNAVRHRPATVADLARAAILVLPAWIEHEPRLALRALASGIPVVATAACGLHPHPLLTTITEPDPAALRAALESAMLGHREEASHRAS